MLISECYICSQGEGPLTGTPSILVRTSTCNLRCKFGKNFCDTPFTSWEPEMDNKQTSQEVYDESVKLAAYQLDDKGEILKNDKGENKRKKHPITHIIISGGEPTLWGKELKDLVGGYLATGFHVTIETNGTKYVELPVRGKGYDLSRRSLIAISPKLKSSVPVGTKHEKKHNKLRINLPVLEEWLKKYPSFLKFVVTGKEDLKEIQDIEKKLKVASDRIYLMPEGITPEEILERGAAVNDLCIEYGYRYSSRGHILLYGNKRGT